MRKEDLHLFGRQLSLWAESAIAVGRSPFRRAETLPGVMTGGGEIRPALVLWINRDSFMAGGVLLTPPKASEESASSGRLCAQALGLRHFATWSPDELVVWEDSGVSLRRHRTLVFPAPRDPEAFRLALHELLEEFKLLSVLGTVPPESLSPYYFANLCRTALEGAFGALTEAARIAQGERRLSASLTPLGFARRKSALVLLRLLGLLAYDRLPAGVQPERLETAMAFALDSLPPPLAAVLRKTEEELPLPAEAAVRYHHLFRRLRQLHFGADRERAAQVLKILLAHEAPRLGGYPLPTSSGTAPHLRINADSFSPSTALKGEIAPLPLLALGALLRELGGHPHLQVLKESCFTLGEQELPPRIVGTLDERTLPSLAQRQALSGYLRTSWPNRRFPLPPHTPYWAWEFLHLLGLAGEGTSIELNLPTGWLAADFAGVVAGVLRENYTVVSLRHTHDFTHLSLRRGPLPEHRTILSDPSGDVTLPWRTLQETSTPLFCLVLGFPTTFASLLTGDHLQSPDSADWERRRREIFRFSRTALGRQLWRTASLGAPLPDISHLEGEARRQGWPVLRAEILDPLRFIPERQEIAAILDRELALRLDLPLDYPLLLSTPATSTRPRTASPRALAKGIAAQVFSDGVPLFPEQYLYDYFRPELDTFSFTGPLQIEENFFGTITLRDADGLRITVEGEESARALELASYSGRMPVRLPRDRRITGAITDRYLHDLRHLQKELLRQTHLRATDARGADHLAQRIWKSLPLPPWPLFER